MDITVELIGRSTVDATMKEASTTPEQATAIHEATVPSNNPCADSESVSSTTETTHQNGEKEQVSFLEEFRLKKSRRQRKPCKWYTSERDMIGSTQDNPAPAPAPAPASTPNSHSKLRAGEQKKSSLTMTSASSSRRSKRRSLLQSEDIAFSPKASPQHYNREKRDLTP
eukprot:13473517-Ditylum_brightwellii.AAC.2